MSNNDSKPQLPLLDRQAKELLAQFGSGNHTPGSGCAAALMGLLAAQLTLTVCRITTEGSPSSPVDLRYVGEEMRRKFIPRLQELFQRDADLFDVVIEARKRREAAEDDREKRRWNERSLELLRQATELVLDVADLCRELVEHGIVIFDQGAKKVRGDSGAAISAAIAAVTTSIFVANLNLRSFRSGEWARATQARVNTLRDEVTERQAIAFERVASLQAVALPEDRLPLLDLIERSEGDGADQ
jgi:formiminotetrahydrofolate cyclodeaminase